MWDEFSRKGWQLAKYFVENSGKIVHLRLRREILSMDLGTRQGGRYGKR